MKIFEDTIDIPQIPTQQVFSFERTTNGVQISVTPIFIEDESKPDENFYLWAYQVRIENNSKNNITILDRHWRVIDAHGRVKDIAGTGVFEDRPTLKPGDAFEYTNSIPLTTSSGIISGKYALETIPVETASLENTKSTVEEIVAPTFSLDSPYGNKILH